MTIIPASDSGQISPQALQSVLDERVLVVSAMLANNETGVISPIRDLVELSHSAGALFLCDAVQAAGRVPVSFDEIGADLMTLSGHKMHGPKGIACLIAGRGVPIGAHSHGGGQERGLRSGTLNTAGIVGFGIAAELADRSTQDSASIAAMRDQLEGAILGSVRNSTVNGSTASRLCNTSNIRFEGADAEAVMANMPSLACSSGSACSSAIPTPSPVLRAMGMSAEAADESIRFSLSRFTTAEEICSAIATVSVAVDYVRHATGSRVA